MKKVALMLIGMIMVFGNLAEAKTQTTIDNLKAIRAIIGEAESDGKTHDEISFGMSAVAHGIRNRGNLRGVYGLHAVLPYKGSLWRFSKGHPLYEIPADVFQQASKAWYESEDGFDFTRGASYWEATKKFGVPSWAKNMTETFRTANHVFFRE